MVGEVSKHPGQTLFGILCMRTAWFSGVATAFQKVDLGDSIPRRCNRVFLESVGSVVVVTVKNLVVVHLSDLDRGDIQVLKQVVELHSGTEGSTQVVEGVGMAVGDVAAANGYL